MAPLSRSHSHPSRSNSSTLLCLFRCLLHCQVRERLDSLGIPVSATYIRSSFLFLLRSLSFPLMNVLNTHTKKTCFTFLLSLQSSQFLWSSAAPDPFCRGSILSFTLTSILIWESGRNWENKKLLWIPIESFFLLLQYCHLETEILSWHNISGLIQFLGNYSVQFKTKTSSRTCLYTTTNLKSQIVNS